MPKNWYQFPVLLHYMLFSNFCWITTPPECPTFNVLQKMDAALLRCRDRGQNTNRGQLKFCGNCQIALSTQEWKVKPKMIHVGVFCQELHSHVVMNHLRASCSEVALQTGYPRSLWRIQFASSRHFQNFSPAFCFPLLSLCFWTFVEQEIAGDFFVENGFLPMLLLINELHLQSP